MGDTHCSISGEERWRLVLMPESSADTFWGKGFLATALGTASPDRKKTHKGQKKLTSSSCDDLVSICRKKKSHQHIWCMQGISKAGIVPYGWKHLDTTYLPLLSHLISVRDNRLWWTHSPSHHLNTIQVNHRIFKYHHQCIIPKRE